MKKYLLILFFLSQVSIAQDSAKQNSYKENIYIKVKSLSIENLENSKFKTTYRIWKSNYQLVELIQVDDTLFKGQVINYISHAIGTNKNPKNELVIHKTTINPKIVEKLVGSLFSEDIETLPDCDEIKDYPRGFDGTSYTFEIKTVNSYRVYSYWEPENQTYQNPNKQEIINVRNILNSINFEFNLWKHFVSFRDRLLPGSYSYGMINMVKFNKYSED